jgi:glycosyltransferase involved in cell wall biosynthesis
MHSDVSTDLNTLAVKSPDVLVSVVAVLHNDEDILVPLIEELTQSVGQKYQFYEIVLVDNASCDGTVQRVEKLQSDRPNIRLIRLSRRYSLEVAIAAGLDGCIGDFVAIIEADRTPAKQILEFFETAIGTCHMVVGRDTTQSRSGLRWLLRKESFKLVSRILGLNLDPCVSYFRVLSRQVVNSITRIRSKKRYLAYMSVMIGFSQVVMPYTPQRRRIDGKRSHAAPSLWQPWDILFSNSAFPLRLAAVLGLSASGLNIIYFGYIFAVTLIKRRLAEGWLTLSLTSTTMFFVLFLILAILSEYIARILEETKEQPLYFVEYESHSRVSAPADSRLNIVQ